MYLLAEQGPLFGVLGGVKFRVQAYMWKHLNHSLNRR